MLNLRRELGVFLFVDELVQLTRILDPYAQEPSGSTGLQASPRSHGETSDFVGLFRGDSELRHGQIVNEAIVFFASRQGQVSLQPS